MLRIRIRAEQRESRVKAGAWKEQEQVRSWAGPRAGQELVQGKKNNRVGVRAGPEQGRRAGAGHELDQGRSKHRAVAGQQRGQS